VKNFLGVVLSIGRLLEP